MSRKLISTALGCLVSLSVTAGTMGEIRQPPQVDYRPWSVIGSLGYTWYNAAYHGGPLADFLAQKAIGDGQTPFGRFALARAFGVFSGLNVGAEIGVQSGNTFRLNIPQVIIDPLGGILPQATIKPMLDLLGTASFQPANLPTFGLVKLGVAYRRMQINDRVTFNDLSQAAFEVQAGLGVQVSDRANLSVNYQGVLNGQTRYVVDPIFGIGHVSRIPNQNGLLLSLAYTV